MAEIKSVKAQYVNQHAPSYSRIWFVCKKNLVYTREATAPLEDNPDPAIQPPSGETSGTTSARNSFGWDGMEIPSAPHLEPLEESGLSKVDKWILMEKLDALENDNARMSKELDDTRYQKLALDGRMASYNLTLKELEQNLATTTQLAEKYKKELDANQRDPLNRRIEDYNLKLKELEQNLSSTMQLAERYKKERDDNQSKLQSGGSLSPSIELHRFCSKFLFSEIQNATNSFDPSLKIGEDAYGHIYKGLLEFAVKIPHTDSPSIPQEFQQEVENFCMLRHQNIINLIGVCPESHTLVYEHCSNGTLEDRLNSTNPFPWQIRVKIATELCTALAFLHSHKPNLVIHGDLRPDNIHLDSNDTCKINGFRMITATISKGKSSLQKKESFYDRNHSEVRSLPYTDPEFFAGGDLTTGSDVYAFGVILMQLLTRKPAERLLRTVQNAVRNNEVSAVLDGDANWPIEQAKLVADLAVRCCDMAADRRPRLEEDVLQVMIQLTNP